MVATTVVVVAEAEKTLLVLQDRTTATGTITLIANSIDTE